MIRAGWTAGLLLVFIAVFRGAAADGRFLAGRPAASDPGLLECESPAGADIAALERCLVFQPDDIELMLDLGAAYERSGRPADAERVYRSALGVDSHDSDARRRLMKLVNAGGREPR